jgi:hypothetical protein
MIKSKFSFLGVYFVSFFVASFFCLGVYFLEHPHMIMHNKFGGTNGPVVPGSILCFGTFGILYLLFRKFTVITIEKDKLRLRNLFFRKLLPRNEIRSIDLLGRKTPFAANNPGEAMKIDMNDGESYFLFDGFYRNMPELKRILQDWYGDIVSPKPVPRQKNKILQPVPTNVEIAVMQKFSGNYLTSINGILFYGICIGFIWMDFAMISSKIFVYWNILLIVMPILMCYVVFAGQLYYFRMSDELLVIENHLFVWYKRIYRLEDIRGVVLESPFKRSYSLRIRMVDFTSKTYAAGSLRTADWRTLAEKLKILSIPFESEVILSA